MTQEASKRIRITSPRTTAGRPRRVVVTEEIDAQTALGEVYLRSLMRSQLRLAVGILGLVGIALGGLPLLFATAPESRRWELLGIPFPWLALGVLVYPTLIGAGWLYVRQAERTESRFAEMAGE
ncbi:MAG TPA: hypothetical protein VEX15_18275 [Nocardioidaceae bacterium]|nr:hypothetical protein [Nocardioidaceae bacterium]